MSRRRLVVVMRIPHRAMTQISGGRSRFASKSVVVVQNKTMLSRE